jgi:hypothetical protein
MNFTAFRTLTSSSCECSYFVHIGEGEKKCQWALERMVGYITVVGLRKTMSLGGKGRLPPP